MKKVKLEARLAMQGPGIIIKGYGQAHDVFDTITEYLDEFYSKKRCYIFEPYENKERDLGKNLVRISPFIIEPNRKKPFDHKVYCSIDNPLDDRPYVILRVKYLERKDQCSYVKEWDFPHAPIKQTINKFSLYFNNHIYQSELEERKAFFNYLKKELMPKSA